MFYGYAPIFTGGGKGLWVEQRGPVQGASVHSVHEFEGSKK